MEETNSSCCSIGSNPAFVVAVSNTPQKSASPANGEGTGATTILGDEVHNACFAALLARARCMDICKVLQVGDHDFLVLRHIEWLDDKGKDPLLCPLLPPIPEAQEGPIGSSSYYTSTERGTSLSDYIALEEEWEITSTSLSDSSWQPSSAHSPSSEEYLLSLTATSNDHTAALQQLRTRKCIFPKRPPHEGTKLSDRRPPCRGNSSRAVRSRNLQRTVCKT